MTAEQLRRSGQPSAAIDVCRDALTRFPGHLSMRVTLGWALLDLGRLSEARQAFEEVRRHAPDNLAAIRGLAQLHTLQDPDDTGDYDSAVDPDPEELRPEIPPVETLPSWRPEPPAASEPPVRPLPAEVPLRPAPLAPPLPAAVAHTPLPSAPVVATPIWAASRQEDPAESTRPAVEAAPERRPEPLPFRSPIPLAPVLQPAAAAPLMSLDFDEPEFGDLDPPSPSSTSPMFPEEYEPRAELDSVEEPVVLEPVGQLAQDISLSDDGGLVPALDAGEFWESEETSGAADVEDHQVVLTRPWQPTSAETVDRARSAAIQRLEALLARVQAIRAPGLSQYS